MAACASWATIWITCISDTRSRSRHSHDEQAGMASSSCERRGDMTETTTDAAGADSAATAAPPSRRRLSVRHETTYRYQGAASLGYSLAWLTPRPLPSQDLREHRLNVFPKPRFLREAVDAFGN